MHTKLFGLAVMLLVCSLAYSQPSQNTTDEARTKSLNHFDGVYDALEDSFQSRLSSYQEEQKETLLTISRPESEYSVTFKLGDFGSTKDLIIDLSNVSNNQINLLQGGEATVTLEIMGKSPAQSSFRPDFNFDPDPYESQYETDYESDYDPDFEQDEEIDSYYGEPEILENRPENFQVQPLYPTAFTSMEKTLGNTNSQSQAAFSEESVKQQMFSVQIGAFSSHLNAKKHVESMVEKGLSDIRIKEEKDYYGNAMYKVLIGSFDQKIDANSFSRIMKKMYDVNGFVKPALR